MITMKYAVYSLSVTSRIVRSAPSDRYDMPDGSRRYAYRILWILVWLAVFPICEQNAWADDDAVSKVVTLKEKDVTESSGLAVSHMRKNRWWTHNDSGGKAKLFAFSSSGKSTGECRLKNVDTKDWEDMASFVDAGQPRLIVADCGDNNARRDSISLYLFDEPSPDKSDTIKRFQTLTVTYSDGPRNCEAIAVDVDHRKIILVEKAILPLAGIYLLDLPDAKQEDINVVAQRVGTLTISMVTAMDLDQNSGNVWIVNYFKAFRFRRLSEKTTLVAQLRSLPDPIAVPRWKQIEAVCVGSEHDVWVTSEGKPAKFGRLKTGVSATR